MTTLTMTRESYGDRVHLSSEMRTAGMVAKRELIRFWRNKTRMIGGLVQPLLFLFVFGYGLGSLIPANGGLDYKMFIFPGSLAMSVVTTSIFGAISIVWDREFGFLREMLVAPVSRASILLGKTLGGATVATFQGIVMLLFAPLVGLKLTPILVVEALLLCFLIAFALTSFGVFIASRMKKMEGFQAVMQFLLFPMIFLSGAQFPLRNLPGWLTVVTRLDPLTYAVDPLRRIVLGAQDVPSAAINAFGGGGVSIGSYTLSVVEEIAAVAVFAVVFLSAAIVSFSKTE
ncbi:MAG: type transport system permease protein [Thermoplasmata archaeon]|jgi:ABC-2 type transport system permease protein|nr:type transport system permease protein [Thermoplasmata archaeon]